MKTLLLVVFVTHIINRFTKVEYVCIITYVLTYLYNFSKTVTSCDYCDKHDTIL